ncbi:MAG TPA: hypothetical protein VFB68_03335 [Xanthobacteraceae bacterium]|nr:hypothetical protein [Xanthobacteraceae bacterium]
MQRLVAFEMMRAEVEGGRGGMDGVKVTGALKRVASLYLLLLLGACAGITPGVVEKLDGIRQVGIISAFGDRFQLRKVGVTVFGNESNEFPVAAWGIDDLVVGKVRTILGRRFDIRPLTYQRAAFQSPNFGGIGAMVQAAAPTSGVDAYIVITRATSQVGATNQSVNGLGILEASSPIYASTYTIYALYVVSIINAKTFASMGGVSALMPGEVPINPMRTTALRGPHRQVDQSWWPTSLDAASNQRLKGGVVELIDQSLANTLQHLQLIN